MLGGCSSRCMMADALDILDAEQKMRVQPRGRCNHLHHGR